MTSLKLSSRSINSPKLSNGNPIAVGSSNEKILTVFGTAVKGNCRLLTCVNDGKTRETQLSRMKTIDALMTSGLFTTELSWRSHFPRVGKFLLPGSRDLFPSFRCVLLKVRR